MTRGLITIFGIALVATVLFVVNHGFGAGHGNYDLALGILGLPWILLPWPQFLRQHDFAWLVVVPFGLNYLLVLTVSRLARRPRKK